MKLTTYKLYSVYGQVINELASESYERVIDYLFDANRGRLSKSFLSEMLISEQDADDLKKVANELELLTNEE